MLTERLDFLDGLRGWAAMLVTVLHIFYQVLPPPDIYRLSLETWWPFTGKFSVAIFFLVSGFSLSLAFIRSGDRTVLYRMLAGRYLRLAIPVLAACAVMSFFMNTGAILAPSERPPELAGYFAFDPTLSHLLRFGLFDVFFDYTFSNSYAPPLWTISYELLGSVLVVSLLLIVGHPLRHIALYGVIGAVCFAFQPWYFLFMAGVFLAGVHKAWSPHMTSRAGALLMIAGAFLSGVSGEQSHVLVLAATLFFVGAIHTTYAVAFLSTRFGRWLGEISFPIYLLHVPVTFAVGLPIYVQDPGSIWVSWFAGFAALVASILASHLFAPVNRLAMQAARWLGRVSTAPLIRAA